MTLPTKKMFEKHADDSFEVAFSEGCSFTCCIEEVKAGSLPIHSEQKEQYAVVFACENPEVFEQGVYKVSHQQLGAFELFLVPIFGDEKGVQYEAVFS